MPFTNVPLLEPRSRTTTLPPSELSSAWRREMVGSKTGRSQVGARPTIRGTPSRRSYVFVPSGLTRRRGMTGEYASCGERCLAAECGVEGVEGEAGGFVPRETGRPLRSRPPRSVIRVIVREQVGDGERELSLVGRAHVTRR